MIRAFDKWLLPYLTRTRRQKTDGPVDLVIAVCDHFEPFHHTDKDGAMKRMHHWAKEFPKLIAPFRDADNGPPKHSFFFPIEQYDEDVIASLTDICQNTGSEVEVHLHHDNDTEETLKALLDKGKEDLLKHGLLSTNKDGNTVYGFIHGDWALDHSHPEGHHCGVANELGLLKRNGCYADFTMPSAPSPTQARMVNSLYYARDTPEPRSHDTGIVISTKEQPKRDDPNFLTLVQGPLALNWKSRKFGLIPRVENGDLTGANPPSAERLNLWLDLGIHVRGRPDTIFAKLHTHGAIERNSVTLLGDRMRKFHQLATSDKRIRLHYATAREMVNMIHALEDDTAEPVSNCRDYLYRSNIQFKPIDEAAANS
jgi:hypothetical protein